MTGPASGANGGPVDVLFVITDLRVGGSERQIALLATELAKAGMTVAVYGFIDGPVRRQMERGGVRVIVAPGRIVPPFPVVRNAWLIPPACIHLLWCLVTVSPRIVHFFLPGAYLLGAPLAVVARIQVRVMSRRSLNVYQRGRVLRAIERRLHQRMQAVLGNSRAVVRQLQDEGVAPDRLGLIYNGVVLERSDGTPSCEEWRKNIGLSSDGLVINIVANLIPYKGHGDLIGALADIAPDLPAGWRLLIVGRDDGLGAVLKSQAAQHGLAENVLFLGQRDDVAAIHAASDIGVLCSHEEGFSNVILEGMAAGLPMVVTDVGGNAEAVDDGETGLVVPARDPRKLGAAILRLANDPALRARLGEAAHRRVAERFSVRQLVARHRTLYAALTAGQRPGDIADVDYRAA